MDKEKVKQTPEKKLIVASSPHIHSPYNITKVMGDVIIALVPAAAAGVYFFGTKALAVIATAVAASVITEYVWQRSLKTGVRINDLSAALTGLLLALTLPPSVPLWMVAVGSFFGVIFGKQVFGGLGNNPFNPALAGRAFLQISWPQAMTSWVSPFDGLSSATPLEIAKTGAGEGLPTYIDMFIGRQAGSLGETSALLLLIGGVYLIIKGHIRPLIPVAYILTVCAGAWLFGLNVLFHALAGGLFLGAFFMATDPSTSPLSCKGKLIFGFGCGLLTILIRAKGGFPEGVCFSILIMNMTVPLIDMWTIPKPFGKKARN